MAENLFVYVIAVDLLSYSFIFFGPIFSCLGDIIFRPFILYFIYFSWSCYVDRRWQFQRDREIRSTSRQFVTLKFWEIFFTCSLQLDKFSYSMIIVNNVKI